MRRRTSSGEQSEIAPKRRSKRALVAAATLSASAVGLGLVALPSSVEAAIPIDTFSRTDLVSDVAGVGDAPVHDPNLVNPEGMSDGASPLWVSNNGKDNSTLYSGDVAGSPVNVLGLVVAVPGGKPTGQVFNGGGGFNVKQGMNSFSSVFIFAGETGQITGWNPGVSPITSAITAVTTPGANYTGLALATATAGRQIYATDFTGRKIDVFDSNFMPVHTPGAFQDRFIPRDFAPFDVATLNGNIYVTYAKQDNLKVHDDPGIGHGFIDVFTPDGTFVRRLVSIIGLNSPWGLTIAPMGFGQFTGDLLVANHGSGLISAYDATNGRFKGFLLDNKDHVIFIKGLWGLLPGNGVAGDPTSVLFTAGPDHGQHGILGRLALNAAAPPSTPGTTMP